MFSVNRPYGEIILFLLKSLIFFDADILRQTNTI